MSRPYPGMFTLHSASAAMLIAITILGEGTGEVPLVQEEIMEDIAYVRTPDGRFADLPDYPFSPQYAQVAGGLRMHYLDEGPRAESVVVLLHGEPSWSFLYRKMIPILVAQGYRVIVPDLIGFGRSDKPVERADHTYERHVEWMRSLLFDHLDLNDVTLFAQDWGGLIGLRVLAENPDRFRRVAVGNTGLPTGDETIGEAFLRWRAASQAMREFRAGQVVQNGTLTSLSAEVMAAYDAPFPDSTFQAGARVMPILVPIAPDDPASDANRAAWDVLRSWSRPFVTFFSDSDPITGPWAEPFQTNVSGAQGQPHRTITDAGHFLQEDKAEELARLLVDFVEQSSY